MMNPFGAMKEKCHSIDICITVIEAKLSRIKATSEPSMEDELLTDQTLRFIGYGLKEMRDENDWKEKTVHSITDVDELLSTAEQFWDSFDREFVLLETKLEPFGYRPKAKVNQSGNEAKTSDSKVEVTSNMTYSTPCKRYDGVRTLLDELDLSELDITPDLFRRVKKF